MRAIKMSVLLIFMASNAFAGDWTVISKDVLSFKGNIEGSELAKFKNIFNSDIKKIIVDSGGGDAEIGLQIGEIISSANIEIEVQGICVSSCANYIFTAGKHKILNKGIVGFHGNMTAMFNSISKDDLIAQMKSSGMSEQGAMAVYNHYLNEILPKEKHFYESLGVSQALFDRTQRNDKGMGSGTYSALLPKPATFEKYGIHNVDGEQSQDVINNDPRVTKYAKLGTPVIID